MTEDDWLTGGYGPVLLDFVRTATVPVRTRWLGWKSAKRFPLSERKIRLVEAACCERIAELLPGAELRSLIDVARLQVDDKGNKGERLRILTLDAARLIRHVLDTEGATPNSGSASFLALATLGGLFTRNDEPGNSVLEIAARARAGVVADSHRSGVHERHWNLALHSEYAAQADSVRDVIGNPFRRETVDAFGCGPTTARRSASPRPSAKGARSRTCPSWPTRSRMRAVTTRRCSTTAGGRGRMCRGAGFWIWSRGGNRFRAAFRRVVREGEAPAEPGGEPRPGTGRANST